MAIEPIYEVAVLDGLQRLCSGQIVAEARLVPPHGEEISKILGVSATADVYATEVFTGEARIKGKVEFRVIYLSTDGKCRCNCHKTEFTDKIADDSIMGGVTCVVAKVLDTDVVSATESEIKLAAVVETELIGVTSKRVKYLVKGGDGIFSHEQSLDCTKVIASFNGETTVTAEEEVNARKIECVESRVFIKKAVASTDMAVIEGEIISEVLCSSDDDMRRVEVNTPFSFEVEANGSKGGALAVATPRLSEVRYTLTEGENNTITLEYEVCVCGFVLDEVKISAVTDVFSVCNELIKSEECVDYVVNRNCTYFDDEADGNVTLGAELPIVDNIVTTLGSSLVLSNVYALDGRVVVEGLARTNVIYFSGESNSCSSVAVEIPFSITKPLPVNENDDVYAFGEIMSVSAKIRRGNEIDTGALLRICVITSEHRKVDMISELIEGAEICAPQSVLSMHVGGKKESLWDVSKALYASPDVVLEQNPDVNFPLEGGEHIIIYRSPKRN